MRHWSTPPWTDPAQADKLIADSAADLAAGQATRLRLLRLDDGRLGFQLEGTLHERRIVASEVSDAALDGLLRRNWTGGVAEAAAPGLQHR